MSFFTGNPASFKRLSNLDPQQMGNYSDLLSGSRGAFQDVGNYYRGLLSNEGSDFDAFAAPELRRFRQQTIPDIAEQFAGAGSGALSSSGFQNASVNAATDLSERLGEMRARLRQQAAQGLQGLGQQGLQSYGENVYQPATPGLFDALGKGLGGAATIAGGIYGGPAGAALGRTLGNLFSGSTGNNPSQGGRLAGGRYGLYPTQGNYNPYSDQSNPFR